MGERKTRMDLTGQRVGRLTVIEFSHIDKHKRSMWKCKCDCGTETVVLGSHLKSRHTTSCGCYGREARIKGSTTHGMRHTRLYRIWLDMKSRCYIANTPYFSEYGGRGITVCNEWRDSFEAFRDWALANGYADDLSIDRIDVNGNYEPSNCRWATWETQCNNRRDTVFITFNGETHSLREWSRITGINFYTMYSRYTAGRPAAEILHEGKLT